MDVEGFELHQDDIPENLLNSIDFWNFQDVVTKLVKFISFLFAMNFLVSFNLNMKNTGYSSKKFKLFITSVLQNYCELFCTYFRYYPAIEEFVKKVTGAQHVFCFDHNLRNSTYVEQKNTQSKTQKPIPQVHTDYTPTSAPRRLLDLTQKPKTNDSYASFR